MKLGSSSTILSLCFAAVTLTGCAVGRDVINPKTPSAANPSTGQAVRIESVVDRRVFEIAPQQADIPSLDSGEDGSDGAKARAVGRKRGGFGKAFGDLVLPEGQTVSGLVGDAVSVGFKQAGYVVVAKGEPGYETAAPVSANINQFWSWMQPGFWSISANNKSEIELKSPVIPQNGQAMIKTKDSDSLQVLTTDDWQAIIQKGLASITEQTKNVLKR